MNPKKTKNTSNYQGEDVGTQGFVKDVHEVHRESDEPKLPPSLPQDAPLQAQNEQ